jgi:uncharacterized membrane protein YcaP (DUF421 family)
MFHDMFSLPLPILEKILRPIIVYLCLVIFLRIFGKRELAQLNPFDLVVLLSLSNTVQNAIIGDDNSVSGGLIGAFSLLAINWLVVRLMFRSPQMDRVLEGTARVLIRHGHVDHKALGKELLNERDLLAAVHRQGFGGFHEIEKCVLEPGGGFYMEGRKPGLSVEQHSELLARLDVLTTEMQAIRAQLGSR